MSGGESGSTGHIDEGTVHAWLDGQLSAAEAARIDAHIRACTVCSALVAEARGYIAASTRILTALDGVPAKVVPAARPTRRAWQMRIAAAIVVMAAGTVAILRGPLGKTSTPSELHGAAAQREVAGRADSERRDVGRSAATPAPGASAVNSPHPERKSNVAERPAPSDERQQSKRALRQPAAPPVPLPAVKIAPSAVGGVTARDRDVPSAPVSQESATPAPLPTANVPRLHPQAMAALSDQRAVDSAATRFDSTHLKYAPSVAQVPAPTMENSLQSKVANAPIANAQAAISSQQRAIVGRVVEAKSGTPVPAASVVVSGTAIGGNTTDSGTFQVDVPADAKSLTVRRIGYLAQSVPLTAGATDYTIPLQRDVLRLETQVMTGVATTVASANSANDVTVLSSKDITGEPPLALNGSPAAATPPAKIALSSRCQNQVLHLRVPRAVTPLILRDSAVQQDSLTARLMKKQALGSAFLIRLIPDSTPLVTATWQPLGTDSAIVTITRPSGATVIRAKCE